MYWPWQVVGVTGLILTKLDGSARGGCVVSVQFFFCGLLVRLLAVFTGGV